MNSYEIKINDIQPLMEVNEFSLYFLLGYIALAIIFFTGLTYIVYYFYKQRKKVNIRKEYKTTLESLNLDDTKKAAYLISSYGSFFKDDSSKHEETYANIMKRLSEYKYKKNVETFDDETLECIKIYKGMLNV